MTDTEVAVTMIIMTTIIANDIAIIKEIVTNGVIDLPIEIIATESRIVNVSLIAIVGIGEAETGIGIIITIEARGTKDRQTSIHVGGTMVITMTMMTSTAVPVVKGEGVAVVADVQDLLIAHDPPRLTIRAARNLL